MEFAFAVLEDGYREGMELEDGIKLALRAIKIATRKDVFTGGGVTLVTVTEEGGYRELSREEIEALLK